MQRSLIKNTDSQYVDTIPVVQEQPYDPYDIAQNTGTISYLSKGWFLHNVRYNIDHNVVPELQEWFLYSVQYHMDHMAVPGLQEWCLHIVSLCQELFM
jgi:uncharacterized protein YijF (DUF1287 family)